MAATENIHMRVDPEVKKKISQVFDSMGLTISKGLSLYIHYVIRHGRIPFDLSVPDRESLRVMKKAKAGKGLHEVASTDELMKELNR